MADNTTTEQTEPIEDRQYRWEITPHPWDSSFDYFVTDDDNAAIEAINHAAEMYLWDGIEAGETRTLTVKHNE